MRNEVKWKWRELKRLYRLLFPEASVRLTIKVIGGFWLWRHGAVREYRIKLWKHSPGWYCGDIVIVRRRKIIEAKGGWKKYYYGDILRDQQLIDKGWDVLRVTEAELLADPKYQRRRLRRFLLT